MPETSADSSAIADRLHLSSGFLETERGWVSKSLAALGPQLRLFSNNEVDLEISLRDRQGTGQRVTLECWISCRPRLHLIATSSERDLSTALGEVGDELIRQLDVARSRPDPRENRTLRLVSRLPEHE